MPWGAAIGAAGAIGGSLISSSAANDRQNAANGLDQQALGLQQQASGLWQNLQVPNLQYTPYSWLQDYVPQTYNADVEPFSQINPDTADASTVENALSQLGQFAQGGLNNTDKVALSQIERQQQGAGNANNQAVIDDLRSRGEGGSGSELAARLSGDQSAADNANTLYSNALQTALQRQLAAVQGQGSLAQGEQATQNQTQQAMATLANQFNENVMGLRTQAASDAANAQNTAQQVNIQGKQGLANANIDQAHNIQQQNFANQEGKVTGQANSLIGQSSGDFAAAAAAGAQANAAEQNSIAGVGAALTGAKTGAQIANNPGGFSLTGANITGNNSANSSSSSPSFIDSTNGGGTGTADTIDTGPNSLGAFGTQGSYRGGPVHGVPIDHKALAALAAYCRGGMVR